ncbi:type IX secretion system membrane protein PorP/SprF [Paracrocinitomix mangrovi]|uniref:type IX secretion system membrane protein PorP/SprF n=1 Tax=Paracrocinitomix mangrovi TaxID=2862509 RepID=UPI001C8DE7B4|nr:type IX secretion system membrane protein PorP/SprF [Paracrocinitomix mangrovi]UKN01863.1 type IX secretion system membrane protein PorP/SprF [Paracrocinitomix mangrovi]
MKKFNLLLLAFVPFHLFCQDPLMISAGLQQPYVHNPASFGAFNKFSFNAAGSFQDQNVIIGYTTESTLNMEYGGVINTKNNTRIPFGIGLNGFYQNYYQRIAFNANIPFAYHLDFDDTKLSFGLAPGIHYLKMGQPWIGTGDPEIEKLFFDLSAGFMWSGENFYAGLSTTHFTGPEVPELPFSVIDRNIHAHGGYRFKIKEHSIYPVSSIAVSIRQRSRAQLMVYYMTPRDIFSVGLGYCTDRIYSGTVGIQLKGIRANYYLNYMPFFSGIYFFKHQVKLSYTLPFKDKSTGNSK